MTIWKKNSSLRIRKEIREALRHSFPKRKALTHTEKIEKHLQQNLPFYSSMVGKVHPQSEKKENV